MKWGNLDIFEINAGNFKLDGGAMFGVVPKNIWEKKFASDAQNRIALSTRCLLVVGPKYKLLIDTGLGSKWNAKEQTRYEMEGIKPWDHLLKECAGLSTNDITHVIITHLHFDHAGGLTYVDPVSGEILSTFANAEIILQDSNLQTAENPNAREKASYRTENWELLKRRGQIKTVHSNPMDAQNILDGVFVQRSDGHTVGQQIVHINGGPDFNLVYCGDLVPTSAHAPEAYTMGYDLQPLVLMKEKKQLLSEAYQNKWWLYFEHDPLNALSRLRLVDRGGGLFDFAADNPLIHHLGGFPQGS